MFTLASTIHNLFFVNIQLSTLHQLIGAGDQLRVLCFRTPLLGLKNIV